MNLFIDTSSIVKRYIVEEGSDAINFLFSLADNIFISNITRIEYLSALTRRRNENSISVNNFDLALKEFMYDFKYFIRVRFDSKIEKKSFEMIKTYSLRALDSIQLASACFCNAEQFITSDKKLFNIAEISLNYKSSFI